MKTEPAQVATGNAPHQIPGSRLWRDWCQGCGEALRVNRSDVGKATSCDQCDPDRKRDSQRRRREIVAVSSGELKRKPLK